MTGGDEAAVYFVGGGRSDTRSVSAATVGSKAFNLMRLDRIGLKVPPAIVLSTGFCREFFARGGALPEDFEKRLLAHLRELENATGKAFGGTRRPLVVSVRSGAPFSMPGMLATVLDVGMNERIVHGLIRMTGNPRLAWDCYRRLVQSFAAAVSGCDEASFAALAVRYVASAGAGSPHDLDAEALRGLARDSLDLFRDLTGRTFPLEPIEQLVAAVGAVFRSWRADRAVEYRRALGLDDDAGTAVIIQPMVFGNADFRSGSGVGFTRDPATGEDRLYLDFLLHAQGEDVVAGRQALAENRVLERALPAVASELGRVKKSLEAEFRDMQDFEFTVEEGRLHLLQTRPGKRTPWAALRIAVDMVRETLIDPATALARLGGIDLAGLERVRLASDTAVPLAVATPASIGVAVGAVALDPERAREMAKNGEPVILLREEMSTADLAGLRVSEGVLAAAGGRTSHAAVVARQLGKVCLVACPGLSIDLANRRFLLADRLRKEGDVLTLDGETGRVFAGRMDLVRERPAAELVEVERWRSAG